MIVRELVTAVSPDFADRVDDVVHPSGLPRDGDRVPRVVLAHALNVALFADLVDRVPAAAEYVADQRRAGRRVVLDHGAVRTVAWPTASPLPAGAEQVARVLAPLGYSELGRYPLPRLRMTGRSFAHDDLPEAVGQWFVSELHPDEFSVPFRRVVERVLSTAPDPLDEHSDRLLAELAARRDVDAADAGSLVAALFGCFRRLHDPPFDHEYDLLRAESAEMAWIATEGTSFNHATDRVDDVERTSDRQRAAGRPIKERIEVSGSGRVRQTAFRAADVVRPMPTAEGKLVDRTVPGSFFEFIERRPLPDGGLDLAFDTSNAQGIFTMSAAAGDR